MGVGSFLGAAGKTGASVYGMKKKADAAQATDKPDKKESTKAPIVEMSTFPMEPVKTDDYADGGMVKSHPRWYGKKPCK
jgi:hypothetical protein